MSRPRYADGEPTARERMVKAFWALLEDGPFNFITVSHIVKAARVNRNSFYYHFSDIDDLAAKAIDELMVPDAVHEVLAGLGAIEGSALVAGGPAETLRLDRLGLIAGDNASPALRGMLHRAIADAYAAALDISLDSLGASDRAFLEFMFGGIEAVLAYRVSCDPKPSIADVSGTEWFAAGIANLRAFAVRHAPV